MSNLIDVLPTKQIIEIDVGSIENQIDVSSTTNVIGVTKKYVDDQDAVTLTSAKSYSDSQAPIEISTEDIDKLFS